MKKKTMVHKTTMLIMTMAMAITLFAGCFISLSAKETCDGHQLVWTKTGTSLERLRTHSHYKEKNGRWDYWPCIVYEKFDHYKLYCLECGYICDTDKISRGEVHNDAY